MDVGLSTASTAVPTGSMTSQAEVKKDLQVQQEEANKESTQQADNPVNGDIDSAVNEVNDFVATQGRELNFSFDEGSNRSVVKVTDTQTGELIRQVPSDEVLKLAQRIQDLQSDIGTAVGVLFSKEV